MTIYHISFKVYYDSHVSFLVHVRPNVVGLESGFGGIGTFRLNVHGPTMDLQWPNMFQESRCLEHGPSWDWDRHLDCKRHLGGCAIYSGTTV